MRAIYLDHAATTSVRPEVREAMEPYLLEAFGNPSSTHRWGRTARNALERARERVAGVLGAQRREIVFTGGGTEADNIAVLGRWRATRRAVATAPVVVCSAIEHKAVLESVHYASEGGARAILLAVDGDGRVDIGGLDEALRLKPCVVSVMWGNNEVGTIQPVREIAERCAAAGVVMHTDAVQAFGKVRVRVDEVTCGLLALSAHKFGGPKGAGVLFVRDGVDVQPIAWGGGQERSLRPGTESVASAVGIATAAELAAAEQDTEQARLDRLRSVLETRLRDAFPALIVHGAGAHRLQHVSSVALPGVDAETFLAGLDLEGLAVSGGSACHSGTGGSSHVLAAMGALDGEPAATVRMSFGHATTEDDVNTAASVFCTVAARSLAVRA